MFIQDGIEELEDPDTVSLLKTAIHTPEASSLMIVALVCAEAKSFKDNGQ